MIDWGCVIFENVLNLIFCSFRKERITNAQNGLSMSNETRLMSQDDCVCFSIYGFQIHDAEVTHASF